MVKRCEWTPAERHIVKTEYGRVAFAHLVQKLNRTPGAIRSMARDLGVMRSQRNVAREPKTAKATIWSVPSDDHGYAPCKSDEYWRQDAERGSAMLIAAIVTLVERRERDAA